jgi:hypothetical protein
MALLSGSETDAEIDSINEGKTLPGNIIVFNQLEK